MGVQQVGLHAFCDCAKLDEESQRYIDEHLFAKEKVDIRSAAPSTRGRELSHRMGRNDPTQTILTRKEFVNRLQKLSMQGKL